MSRLKEMAAHLEKHHCFEEQEEVRKTSVTGRLTEEEVFRIDYVAKRIGMARSRFAQALMTEGCLEAAEGLGIDLPEFQALYLSEKFKKPVEECREMLSKTGFSSQEEK